MSYAHALYPYDSTLSGAERAKEAERVAAARRSIVANPKFSEQRRAALLSLHDKRQAGIAKAAAAFNAPVGVPASPLVVGALLADSNHPSPSSSAPLVPLHLGQHLVLSPAPLPLLASPPPLSLLLALSPAKIVIEIIDQEAADEDEVGDEDEDEEQEDEELSDSNDDIKIIYHRRYIVIV